VEDKAVRGASNNFDGGNFIIQKSDIYQFSGTNQEPFDLFLRYMATGMNEKEDTTKYAS
jgi:hypothetical protein